MAEIAYFDYAATSQVDSRVADVVYHYMREEFGNSGSRTHPFGVTARNAVEEARQYVADVVDADIDEVVFTSGATEADNLAILGLAPYGEKINAKHIITTAIEHKAVLEPIEHLETLGFEVTIVGVDSDGLVNVSEIASHLRKDTLLVSVMHVNNETGMIQPIDEIAELLREESTFFHVDAAQGFGKEFTQLKNKRIDLISVSGHKIYGPKGIGALIARKRNGRDRPPLTPLMHGGGQERGFRPGTVPVALAAGLGEASRLALVEGEKRNNKAKEIEKQVLKFLQQSGGTVNGNRDKAIPQIINASFKGLDSEAFIVATKAVIAVSNGAACSSHAYERSHVLESMNLESWRVGGAIRFSFSHDSVFPDGNELYKIIDSVRF